MNKAHAAAEERYPEPFRPRDKRHLTGTMIQELRHEAFLAGAIWQQSEDIALAENAVCDEESDWGQGWDDAANFIISEINRSGPTSVSAQPDGDR